MNVITDPTTQEIWRTVRAMNDAWTKGDPTDLAEFFHEEMVAITPTDRERVRGRAACIDNWARFRNTTLIHRWEEFDPEIHVYGDAAVVAYYYRLECDLDGHIITMSGRDMFFMVKRGDRWWAVADQFSSFPS